MTKKDIIKKKKGEVIREAQIDGNINTNTRERILYLVLFVALFLVLIYLIFD